MAGRFVSISGDQMLDIKRTSMMGESFVGEPRLSQPNPSGSEMRPAVAPQHETAHTNAIIEAHGLTKTYSSATRNVPALEDVNFQIKDGEFVCLVGPSGCG
jgi:ABC-type glutathione transport system ATPase component